jgi:hypothetical protein
VAPIPSPRKNQIRYHGFFGPNAKIRGELVPSAEADMKEGASTKIHRLRFAKLMARVFGIDILQCPRCNSRMQLISFVQDPKSARDILNSLKMSTAPPDISGPADYMVCFEEDADVFMDDAQ